MLPTQLEFEITQWLDGELPPQKLAMLRRQLENDPRAAQLEHEYRNLNQMLEALDQPPQVDWGALHSRITTAVESAAEQRGRMLPKWSQLAIAACALLAFGLVMQLFVFHGTFQEPIGHGMAMVQINGQTAVALRATAVTDVNIGPPASSGDAETYLALDTQPYDQAARIVIAPGTQPQRDAVLVALAQ